MTDPTSDLPTVLPIELPTEPPVEAMTDRRSKPKRWEIAIVCVMIALVWAAGLFWQHEHSRAEAAVRHSAAAARAYAEQQPRVRAAKARRDAAHNLINIALLTDDQDAGLAQLGVAMRDLRGDVEDEVALWADIVDALTRRDFNRYDGQLYRFDPIFASWDRHLAQVNVLSAQLGLTGG